ncbi:hypothetical protein EX30DRAFT_190852 [Ascodesmis nigricans]|uniref:Uncharacterized protein n=1 Tax=Ascodesmis nigricans TaxID=341454 RepID=A0A4S2N0G0_9PEZI|nr:hypothetical protein EX30DRAFT_190852 [Ascodesmis nigricans]
MRGLQSCLVADMVGVQRTLSQVGASLHNAIMIHTRWTPIRLGGCMALGVGSALGILFKGHFVLSTSCEEFPRWRGDRLWDPGRSRHLAGNCASATPLPPPSSPPAPTSLAVASTASSKPGPSSQRSRLSKCQPFRIFLALFSAPSQLHAQSTITVHLKFR